MHHRVELNPMNKMFDMKSLIEPNHVHLNEGFKNAPRKNPYLSSCIEFTKKMVITQIFEKQYYFSGQLLSYLRTQTYLHLLSKKIQRSHTLVTQIHLKNKISSRLVTSEQTCLEVIRLTLHIHDHEYVCSLWKQRGYNLI